MRTTGQLRVALGLSDMARIGTQGGGVNGAGPALISREVSENGKPRFLKFFRGTTRREIALIDRRAREDTGVR